MSLWVFAEIISKVMIYLGISAAIGGIFILWLQAIGGRFQATVSKYCLCLICVGILGVVSNFFILVGAFSDSGLTGVTDAFTISMLWQSPVGDALIYRIIALLSAIYIVVKNVKIKRFNVLDILLYILSSRSKRFFLKS